MRTQLSALSALSALLVTLAAAAQPASGPPPGDGAEPSAADEAAPAKPAAPTPSFDLKKTPPPAIVKLPAPKRAAPLAPPVVSEGLPPAPLAPPAIFPSQLEEEDDEEEIVGIHEGRVFFRHPHDVFRFYLGGRLRTDFTWAAFAPELTAAQGGSALMPQLRLRRVRFDFSGELMQRILFTAGIELGGARIGATTYHGPTTSRFARASAHDGVVRPAEVSVSYLFRPWLSLSVGQLNTPFSMSNRTREEFTPLMERNIAIRGLAVPDAKDIGLTFWGEVLDDRQLNYELAVIGGDGPDHIGADALPDFVGRIFARPFASLGKSSFHKLAQIGVSGRIGGRDQRGYVDYDYPAIASGQGFVLWQPGYVDSTDRVIRVLPSGVQRAIGGELRLPFDLPRGRAVDLRFEAYYVDNDTREAVDGYELTNIERFGRVEGMGWYASASLWACGDTFIDSEPGIYRPVQVDLSRDAPTKRGLEVTAVAAGIVANYSGAARDGEVDANTPESNIALYQFGGAFQYWFGRNFRTSVEYMVYFAPDSGQVKKNQAVVPDNLHENDDDSVGGEHLHQELGARLAVTF